MNKKDTQLQAALLFDRAIALGAERRWPEALAIYDRLAREHPQIAAVHVGRANALWELGAPEESLKIFEHALTLEPDNDAAWFGKGTSLYSLGRHREAVDSFDRALVLKPGQPKVLHNKALALHEWGCIAEAAEVFSQALRGAPDNSEIALASGMCLLLAGDFARGLPLYEMRLRERIPESQTHRGLAIWAGEDLKGKTLLIQAEQGLGDTIQFCRYALLLRGRGARLVLQVPDRLTRLLRDLDPDITVTGTQVPEACDLRVMLMSLPLLLGTRLDTIPAPVPYLKADPRRAVLWKERIGGTGFRIGIVWQGEKTQDGRLKASDIGRSFPLSSFASIARLPGVRLISLQKHEGVGQLRSLPAGMTVETPGEDFDAGADAFLDSAALMESLDLVITSDTAMAHLAGALGKTVWLALKHVPEWRWGLRDSTTPWYPTMRLFRQPKSSDWESVFAEMTEALRERTAGAEPE